MRRTLLLLAPMLVGALSCEPPRPNLVPLPLPAGKQFAQNPNLLPGGEIAVIAGAPADSGTYAFRVRLPRMFRVMPHSHPDDRLYTVLSGVWTIGIGSTFDPDN